jgi:hypothetical protein
MLLFGNGLGGFGGLTRDFWAGNGKIKTTAMATAIE